MNDMTHHLHNLSKIVNMTQMEKNESKSDTVVIHEYTKKARKK